MVEFRGLKGLTGAELRRWFPWRVLVLAGLGVAVLLAYYAGWSAGNAPTLGGLIYPYFAMWSVLLVVAIVATTQGAVAAEIEQGTAAWVVAKPVSRSAFVLSKFLAAIPAVLVAIGLPAVVARFVFDAAESQGQTEFRVDDVLRLASEPAARGEYTTAPGIGRLLSVLAVLAAVVLLVAAVMVLLGCILRRATPILATGILVPVVLVIASSVGVDHQILVLTPAWLTDSLVDAVTDNPAPVLGPVAVAAAWTAALIGLAIWRFERKEL